MTFVLLNVLILIANILVLAITLKLYTEYFKDRKIEKRGKP
jgi:Tfp pilus assembly major pilin PilA